MSSDYDGMIPEQVWAQTAIHRHSRYSCARCGEEFRSPHAFYGHIDQPGACEADSSEAQLKRVQQQIDWLFTEHRDLVVRTRRDTRELAMIREDIRAMEALETQLREEIG